MTIERTAHAMKGNSTVSAGLQRAIGCCEMAPDASETRPGAVSRRPAHEAARACRRDRVLPVTGGTAGEIIPAGGAGRRRRRPSRVVPRKVAPFVSNGDEGRFRLGKI